jgi:hypothetical protein
MPSQVCAKRFVLLVEGVGLILVETRQMIIVVQRGEGDD